MERRGLAGPRLAEPIAPGVTVGRAALRVTDEILEHRPSGCRHGTASIANTPRRAICSSRVAPRAREARLADPASPTSRTPWPSPRLAWRQRSNSCASSWSRPTIGCRSSRPCREAAPPARRRAEWRRPAQSRPCPERLCAQMPQLEQLAQQPPGAVGHHHLPGLGHFLQPGREVGRLAHDRLTPGAHPRRPDPHHHQPGGDTDPAGQRFPGAPEPRHRRDDRQPRPHRALGIVLMRCGQLRSRASTPSPMNLAIVPLEARNPRPPPRSGRRAAPATSPPDRAAPTARSSRPGPRTSRSAVAARPALGGRHRRGRRPSRGPRSPSKALAVAEIEAELF